MIPIVAGLVAGVGSSLWISDRQARAPVHIVEMRAAPMPSVEGSSDSARREAEPAAPSLREQMRAVEASARPPVGHETAAPPDPESQAAARARLLRERDALYQQHAAQPVDGSWAPEANQSLGGALHRLGAEGHFRVQGVDCRTTLCVATLEWPSYGEATANYARVLHEPYAVNCRRSILLPEPADRLRPYDGRLVFDCEGFRAREAESGR